MPRRIRIDLETTKHLTAREELALVRAGFARSPSPAMRWRLAKLLMADDNAAAVTDLLSDRTDLGLVEEMMLALAWLAGESAQGNIQARAAAGRALALAGDPVERAAALAVRAKAEARLGEVAAARATLSHALGLDPHNRDACKRLAALALAEDDTDAVLAMYDDLTAQGAAHARLFVAKAIAHARRIDHDAVRTIMGTDRFFRAQTLSAPPGWATIEAFNAALAEELLAHPDLRYERNGTASELSWRIDAPLNRSTPLVRVLMDHIAETVADHVAGIDAGDHPWATARPATAVLRASCVITDGDGFENWHVHQSGWLSGAYYVRVPDAIAEGDDEAGCIALGLPEDLAGAEAAAAYGTQLVRPQDGLLLMFPSHTFHRTYPHGGRDRRICVAFDLNPSPRAAQTSQRRDAAFRAA